MSHFSFDVLTEPWIPVVRSDGSIVEMGILHCLEQAHTLREIRDPAPIVEFGLYRLLEAFLFDALQLSDQRPEHRQDLKIMIDSGGIDMDMIKKYIEKCDDAFNLFHPERPFLQTKMDTSSSKPLSGMFPAAPSGTNVSHWRHSHEDDLIVSSAEAARLLTTIAPFMTAGGAGLSPSINGAPALYALPVGKNLFETLVLNIPLRNQDSGQGVAAWRSTQTPGRQCTQATTIEAMTWRPRRIQLIPEIINEKDVVVRTMKFEKGDSAHFGSTWIDANLAYRYEAEKVTPIRMRENRPIWRDAGPLLLLNDKEHGREEKKISFRRPDVIELAFELKNPDESLVVQTYGMRTDMKMKVFEWISSSLTVPAGLGRSTRLGGLVHQEIERAEKAAYVLRVGVKSLFPREGAGNKEALGCIADRCERTYWQKLEHQFYSLMNSFAAMPQDAPDDPVCIAKVAKEWRQNIAQSALEQFELAAKDMDSDSDALERQVRARMRLKTKVNTIIEEVLA